MMDMRETILGELKQIESACGVRVLHAVESGSRAWGFASPDSDFDVRFIYVRPPENYIRLDEPRDVIEWKDDGLLDINGWDLKKAMIQAARGNATLFEWSGSPVVYRTTETWKRIRGVVEGYFSEKTAAYHYYGTAVKTFKEHLTGETVRYKKYFYALRPLLCAQYIEHCHAAPPVLFEDLLKMDMEPSLRSAIDLLLEKKKTTTEGEFHPHIPAIRDFIREELPKQKAICARMPDDRNKDWGPLNRCFAETIGFECQKSDTDSGLVR